MRTLARGLVAAAATCGLLLAAPGSSAASGTGAVAAGATAPALATGSCYWLVTPRGGAVNVRSGPGTSYRIVSVVYPGQRLFYRWTTANGWYAVGDEGLWLLGYMSSSVTWKVYLCF